MHVLPPATSIRSPRDTQPTDAPRRGTTYAPSYGSGDLSDHGGPEISSAGFLAIYWNSSVADSPGPLGVGTLRTGGQNFVSAFNGSADYSVITQYGSSNPIRFLSRMYARRVSPLRV